MAALLFLVILVDELLKFIEFLGPDFLKSDAEGLLFDPLHSGFLDRQRRSKPGNDQTNNDNLSGEDIQGALNSCPSEREIKRATFDFM